jgi:hypothetical protein
LVKISGGFPAVQPYPLIFPFISGRDYKIAAHPKKVNTLILNLSSQQTTPPNFLTLLPKTKERKWFYIKQIL